jgi:hypothetical protein
MVFDSFAREIVGEGLYRLAIYMRNMIKMNTRTGYLIPTNSLPVFSDIK